MNAGRERHESMYGFRIPWHEYLPFALERIATNDGIHLAFSVDDLINVAAVYVVKGLDAAIEESAKYLPAPKSDAWAPLFKPRSRFCTESEIMLGPLAAAHATSPKDEYRLAMERAKKRRPKVAERARAQEKDRKVAAAAAAAILGAAAGAAVATTAAMMEEKEEVDSAAGTTDAGKEAAKSNGDDGTEGDASAEAEQGQEQRDGAGDDGSETAVGAMVRALMPSFDVQVQE